MLLFTILSCFGEATASNSRNIGYDYNSNYPNSRYPNSYNNNNNYYNNASSVMSSIRSSQEYYKFQQTGGRADLLEQYVRMGGTESSFRSFMMSRTGSDFNNYILEKQRGGYNMQSQGMYNDPLEHHMSATDYARKKGTDVGFDLLDKFGQKLIDKGADKWL